MHSFISVLFVGDRSIPELPKPQADGAKRARPAAKKLPLRCPTLLHCFCLVFCSVFVCLFSLFVVWSVWSVGLFECLWVCGFVCLNCVCLFVYLFMFLIVFLYVIGKDHLFLPLLLKQTRTGIFPLRLSFLVYPDHVIVHLKWLVCSWQELG